MLIEEIFDDKQPTLDELLNKIEAIHDREYKLRNKYIDMDAELRKLPEWTAHPFNDETIDETKYEPVPHLYKGSPFGWLPNGHPTLKQLAAIKVKWQKQIDLLDKVNEQIETLGGESTKGRY